MAVIESRLIWAAYRIGRRGMHFRITHTREGIAGHGLDWNDVVRACVLRGPRAEVVREHVFSHNLVAQASETALMWAHLAPMAGHLWSLTMAPPRHTWRESDNKPDLEKQHGRPKNVRKPKFTFYR